MKECSAFKIQYSCCDFNTTGIRPKANVEPRGRPISGIYLLGRGTARSSNQAPNNAIDTKQKAHKQE